jgi:signal transduction histidine kinase/DNA-binding NarL/FixJ family response regulator
MTLAQSSILLVEDEEAHAELVERAFEQTPQCRLTVADSVRAARAVLTQVNHGPDLVITDLNLPDGSGTELLEASPSPLIVITSQGDEAAAVEAMKAGALDYIVKSESMFMDMPHIAERSLREWRLRAERDRIETERRRADERLRLALANAPISAMTQDRELAISWIHDPVLGAEARRVIGKTDYDLLPHDSAERVASIKRAVIETGEPSRQEVLVVSGDETRIYDLSVFPHRTEGSSVSEITCVSVDVTERRQLEDALAERERLASVGMAASILAHEIGNPLNNMFLNAQVLQRRLGKADVDESISGGLSTIMGEIRRLNALLKEFRSLSRRETLDLQPTDVGSVLGLVLDSTMSGAPHVRLERDVPEDLEIQGDADKLTQVFLNLCKNACEAMPEGGTLTVRATRRESSLVVEISDTGSGIPEGLNVFEAFRTTKDQGTGLGLPIVRQLVSAHAGTVSYSSVAGQGTTFRVVLPVLGGERPSSRPPPTSG